MIMCGPPSGQRELYDYVFLKTWKKYGRGQTREEFARSSDSKDLYAGKILADFSVFVRWNRRNLSVKVNPADPQWHMRMRKAFATIINRTTLVEGQLDARRIRLEDARRPAMSTRIDETSEGLTLLSKLAQFELRLVVLEPPGEGRLEPLAEAPSYKFPEPVPIVPGSASSVAKQDDLLAYGESNAKLLHRAIISSMNPIAVKMVRMAEAAPKGLQAMHEQVLKDMYTAPMGANVAHMDGTGALRPSLIECACPDVAAASNELSLAYARKICKILTFANNSTDAQIDAYVKNACNGIADKFQARAIAWCQRTAPRLECPNPAAPVANMGTSLPAKLHTVCNPIGERVVAHIEQHLIASSYLDPYRMGVNVGTSPAEALNGTKMSIFEDRDRLSAFAIENGKRRSAYICSTKDGINDATHIRGTMASASKMSSSTAAGGGAVRSALLSGRPMLRVDPIGARLLGRKEELHPPPKELTLVSWPESEPGVQKLRQIQCSHCKGDTEVLAVAASLPAGLPTNLPIIECRACGHGKKKDGMPHTKGSMADAPDGAEEAVDAEAPAAPAADAPAAATPEAEEQVAEPVEAQPAPPAAVAEEPVAPAAPQQPAPEDRSLMEFTPEAPSPQQQAPAPAPTRPEEPVQSFAAPVPVSSPGANVPLPPLSRRHPTYAAAVAQPLPAYPARGMSLLRVVNSSARDITVNIATKAGQAVVAGSVNANSYLDLPSFPHGIYVVSIYDDAGQVLGKQRAYRFTQRNLHALDYEVNGAVTMRMVHAYLPNKVSGVNGFFARIFGAPGMRVSADTGIYILPSSAHVSADAPKHLFIKASEEDARKLMERTFEDDGLFSGGAKTVYSSFEVPAHQTNVKSPLRIVRDELNSQIAVRRPDGTDEWANVENVFSVKSSVAGSGHGSLVMVVDAPIEHVHAAAKC